MKRILFFFLFATAAFAQSDGMIHVKGFPGADVGAKVAAAQLTCANATTPCMLVIDASLAAFPNGTWPTLCGNCSIVDYRDGWPSTNTIIANVNKQINVQAPPYSATGNGTTNDCASITAAVVAAQAGQAAWIYFPPGTYNLGSACNLTLSNPGMLTGSGQCGNNQGTAPCATTILSSDPTGVLFTVTSPNFRIADIALRNSATSTAGAAIYVNGTNAHQKVDLKDISIYGFYDAISRNAGAYWVEDNVEVQNPVRYGTSIANAPNPDEGDWSIVNSSCVGGPQTDDDTTPGSSACIAQTSSGGGKIINVKSNATFTHGYYGNLSGSAQLLMMNNDFENTTASPIYFAQGWPFISIIGNYLNTPCNVSAITVNGLQGFVIADNNFQTTCGTASTATALAMTNPNNGTIIGNYANGKFAARTTLHGSTANPLYDYDGLLDPAGNLVVSQNGTITKGSLTLGCQASGCNTSEAINFFENIGGAQSASITNNYNSGGMTFTGDRSLAGHGFNFASPSATVGYIDSLGNWELPVAGSKLILKSPDGTCYPLSVPNGGASLTLGSSTTCPI